MARRIYVLALSLATAALTLTPALAEEPVVPANPLDGLAQQLNGVLGSATEGEGGAAGQPGEAGQPGRPGRQAPIGVGIDDLQLSEPAAEPACLNVGLVGGSESFEDDICDSLLQGLNPGDLGLGQGVG